MRTREKLLILLLSISLFPIFLVRCNAQRSMETLGNELASQTGDALVRNAGYELKRLVEDHARVLNRERGLVEMALRIQALEVEKRLRSSAGASREITGWTGWQPADSAGDTAHLDKHCRIRGSGKCVPLDVSYDAPSFRIPRGEGNAGKRDLVKRLESLAGIYRSLETRHPNLIHWQLLALENGVQAIYPGVTHVPGVVDARRTDWYRQTISGRQLVWSQPMIDPVTRRLSFTISTPVYGPAGAIAGAAAIVVPVDAFLHENVHVRMLSASVKSMLVRAEDPPDVATGAVRIIAREAADADRHRHWWDLPEAEYLVSEDSESLGKLYNDLSGRRNGVLSMRFMGSDHLLAYGMIDRYGTALLLAVPRVDVVADAVAMEDYVHRRIARQMALTGSILAAVVAAVVLLAFMISRAVTRNIQRLQDGARRLSEGDFSARVDIRARDEMGQLGRAFNQMVPALEERMRLKNELSVAREVQQSLLPRQMPVMGRLDIAGHIIYCDETGGDFYDILSIGDPANGRLCVAVGDVAGHGMSAALLMASVRAFLRCRMAQPGNPADIITDVNRLVVGDSAETSLFMTLFFLAVDSRSRHLAWTRAGHDPALLYDPGTEQFAELGGPGLALGIDDAFVYEQQCRDSLQPGQVIVIGTDGIWETRDADGSLFGKARLKSLVRRHAGRSAREIIREVAAELEAHRGGAAREDDVTMVVIRVNG